MLFKDVDFFTGARVEKLCYQITIPSLGDFRRYMAPSGGLGAKGALSGGHGGDGGSGGDIFIDSANPLALGNPTPTSVRGHNGVNPNDRVNHDYSTIEIGRSLRIAGANGNTLETNSTGGSGGSPGGAASGRSGSFGAKGADGNTRVQGSVLYP